MKDLDKTIEIRCKVCDTWYETNESRSIACPSCGFKNNRRLSEEPPAPDQSNVFSLNLNKSLLPIKENDVFLVKAMKWVINAIFLVYLFIMGLISYLVITFSG
jgi:ribosomal protein L37E